MNENSSYSHPDAPVRHSYPLAIESASFSQAVTLLVRTLPYDTILTAIVWGVMLAPAFLLLAILPTAWAPGGFIAELAIAALLAYSVRQAFLKPLFLVMVMTKFHVAVRNQPINLEWDQRLTSLSGKFRDLKDKAASGWAPSISPIPSGVPPSGQ